MVGGALPVIMSMIGPRETPPGKKTPENLLPSRLQLLVEWNTVLIHHTLSLAARVCLSLRGAGRRNGLDRDGQDRLPVKIQCLCGARSILGETGRRGDGETGRRGVIPMANGGDGVDGVESTDDVAWYGMAVPRGLA